jgi:hypothetical protein
MNGGLKPSGQAAIDALTAHVAVLDVDGRVIAVNDAWRRYGRQHGATSDSLGADYVALCLLASDDPRARRAAKGLRRLLSGEAEHFDLAYASGDRIFRMRARLVNDRPARLVVAHEDITAVVQARQTRAWASRTLSSLHRGHATRAAEVYESVGQRLAAIGLAARSLERAGVGSTALATIRVAVDEAKLELKRLRQP